MSLKYVDEYTRKLTFADEAVKVIKSGDRVIYAFGVCCINELDRALALRRNELNEIKIICNDMSCVYYAREADPNGQHYMFYEGIYPGIRASVLCEGEKASGFDYKSNQSKIKSNALDGYIFMATVSPMDKHGNFWFGSNAAEKRIFKKYYEIAKYVILEINERILEGSEPDQECIHISQADCIVGSYNSELLKKRERPGKYYHYTNNKPENAIKAV